MLSFVYVKKKIIYLHIDPACLLISPEIDGMTSISPEL